VTIYAAGATEKFLRQNMAFYCLLELTPVSAGSMTPLKPILKLKMKSRIPQLFWLRLRYGTGIFPYETVLRDIPFLKSYGSKTTILNFSGVI
jgi:hypothetical protein